MKEFHSGDLIVAASFLRNLVHNSSFNPRVGRIASSNKYALLRNVLANCSKQSSSFSTLHRTWLLTCFWFSFFFLKTWRFGIRKIWAFLSWIIIFWIFLHFYEARQSRKYLRLKLSSLYLWKVFKDNEGLVYAISKQCSHRSMFVFDITQFSKLSIIIRVF